jgi:hypothetical protein
MRNGFLVLALGGALSLACSYGAAQPVAQRPYTNADVPAFTGGPDLLSMTINAIQASTGGDVTEIRFVEKAGRPGFDAAVVRGGRVSLMRIAAPTSNVVAISTSTAPVWLLHWRARRDVRVAEHAKYSLVDAVRTAEQANGGAPAVAAGIATSASNPSSDVHAYNVLVKIPGGVRRVAVDSATNAVIADPSALEGWP